MERADLELIVAIREQGSLSGAAARLGMAPPAVTKRLAALEQRLGQQLFQRSTRRVSATAEGEAACERARGLLQGFRELEDELGERKSEPAGAMRLVATMGFGRVWLGAALARFQLRYPKISFQLQLTEHLPDLAAEGFDGAIWLWSVSDQRVASQWVSRKLAPNRRVLVAAPSYLERVGAPTEPADLAAHECLVVRENARTGERFDSWQLQHDRGTSARVRVQGRLTTNSGELARDWCLQGHGIALRSQWDVASLLDSGALVRVLPEWAMRDADIHWLAPWQPKMPARQRLLVDFLAGEFAVEPWMGTRRTIPAKASARRAPPGSRRTR